MKFSVIVPVFNTEKYLKRCINSVINQQYEDWELLLIDDGSSDNSPQIIDEFAKMDSRITAIHQNNAGPGEARNRGIELSRGEFIAFLDSDDYIDQDYMQLLLPKTDNADVVFIDVLQVSEDGNIISRELMSSYKEMKKDRILRAQMTGKIPWGGVRKIVRRSLLVDNRIRYTSHAVGEEALYSFRIVYSANRIDFLSEKPVYYYINRLGSQSKVKMEDPWGGVVDTIKDYLDTNGLIHTYGNTLNAFNATATIISINRIYDNCGWKKSKEGAKHRVKLYKDSFLNNKGVDYKSMDAKALVVYPFLTINWIAPILLACKLKGRYK